MALTSRGLSTFHPSLLAHPLLPSTHLGDGGKLLTASLAAICRCCFCGPFVIHIQLCFIAFYNLGSHSCDCLFTSPTQNVIQMSFKAHFKSSFLHGTFPVHPC